MLPEINPLDLTVIAELSWSAGPKNRSIVDDISAVRDLQGFSDVVIGDQNADLFGFQMVNDLLDLEDRNRIDTRKRLVQKNEFWRDDQRSCYFHPAPFTTR